MTEMTARLGQLDHRILLALAARRVPFLDRVMRTITRLGDPVVMLSAGSLLLFGPSLVPIPDELARHTAVTILLTHLFGQLVKRRVSRARPFLPVGLRSLVEPPDHFSFPSGHASAGLAFALPLALWLPLAWGIPVLLVGLLIGVSRAYLGVHFPGDVLAGWSIATATELLLRALG